MTKHEDPTSAKSEVGPVLCGCGDKLPVGTYYVDDVSPVHVHHGRTECHICDHPDRASADARTPQQARGGTCACPPKDRCPIHQVMADARTPVPAKECDCFEPKVHAYFCRFAGASVPAADDCAMCGKLRTKAEGGSTFTVCDECWKLVYPPVAADQPVRETEDHDPLCSIGEPRGDQTMPCDCRPSAPAPITLDETDSTGKPTIESLLETIDTLRQEIDSLRHRLRELTRIQATSSGRY